jgi:hypothetical protein
MGAARQQPAPDQGLPLPSMSESELLTLVRRRPRSPLAAMALHELARRDPSRGRETAVAVAEDREAPAQLRAAAAVALADRGDPRAQRALLAAVDSDDPGLVRRAAEALGRTGNEEALRRLEALRPPRAAGDRVAFARSLIAYRHGLDGPRLKRPDVTVPAVQRARAVPLTIQAMGEGAWEKLAREQMAPSELPAIPTASRGVVSLHCGDERLLLVPNRMLEEADALQQILRRPAIPAALMKWADSLDHWYVQRYLFSHPVSSSRVELIGTSPTGTVVYAGEAVREGEAMRFTLQALDTPLSPPVLVTGAYEAHRGRLSLDEALAEPDRGRAKARLRVPRPSE